MGSAWESKICTSSKDSIIQLNLDQRVSFSSQYWPKKFGNLDKRVSFSSQYWPKNFWQSRQTGFIFQSVLAKKSWQFFLRIGNTNSIVQCASPSQKKTLFNKFSVYSYSRTTDLSEYYSREEHPYVNILMDNTPPASSGNRD